VGGWILDREVLEQAEEVEVRGIIAGGVSAELCPLLETLSVPVMITEGFGDLPIADPVFELLNAHLGREAMITAETRVRWGASRPEIVIPLRLEGEVLPEESQLGGLEIGTQVRVVRDPYLGAIGTISHLPDRPHRIESGARVPVAELVLAAGEETVFVPLANLERVG
jgi:hypothetical protein